MIFHQAEHAFQDVPFEYVSPFRLYMAPFAISYCHRHSVQGGFLDLDDVESITRRGTANLYRRNERLSRVHKADQEAERYAKCEHQVLNIFDRIAGFSQQDQPELHRIIGQDNIEIIPNVVRVSNYVQRATERRPFTFLFVGNLHDYFNKDAVKLCITQVLPLLRGQVSRPVCLLVVDLGHHIRIFIDRHQSFFL